MSAFDSDSVSGSGSAAASASGSASSAGSGSVAVSTSGSASSMGDGSAGSEPSSDSAADSAALESLADARDGSGVMPPVAGSVRSASRLSFVAPSRSTVTPTYRAPPRSESDSSNPNRDFSFWRIAIISW
ncbi:hypothetical protein C486_14639 [Natrinema gari JCM 14663]|uniref:Uncharacterized protein n=1 Tax=Natrinema gari JCM 14663 TaxID=1230459 RepID=L9YUR0_9EURY|nr:hypothetical protein C486_14639 [Natrinema gari JCM 14663]